MQAGIEAVMDVVAPPVRAPRDAPAPPEAKSFEDHLDASEPAPERPQRVEASAEQEEPRDAAPDTGEDTSATLPPPPQNCAPPANPLTLQIIDTIDSAIAPTDEAAANAETEAAPTQPAPQAPPPAPAPTHAKPHAAKSRNAEAAAQPSDAPIAAEGVESEPNPEAPKPATETKSAAPSDAPEAAPTAQPPAQQEAAPPPQQQAALTPQPQSVAKPPTSEQTDTIADVTAAPPLPKEAARAPAPSPDTPAQPEADARDARRADATPQTSNQKDGASNAPTAAPRETFTALLAQQENAQQTPTANTAIAAATPTASTQAPGAIVTPHAAVIATPASQVGREIIRKFDGENTRFELRLDPPELGRVEVKLEVSRDHRVTAVVAADSPQALAELTRHARDIEQALQSAGLELNENGLSFDLSQRRENLADARDEQSRSGGDTQTQTQQDTTPIPSRALTLDAWRGARVDLVA
jgi:flagellar hook-length control protein FliK